MRFTGNQSKRLQNSAGATRIAVDIVTGSSGPFTISKESTSQVAGRPEPFDIYTILRKEGVDAIMQDTTAEYEEHQTLWDNVTGSVLSTGLGIGYVNQTFIDNAHVTDVTIIEKEQDVIDLVWNQCPKNETFTLIKADDLEWTIPKGSYWDTCWFDSWIAQPDNTFPYQDWRDEMFTKFCDHCGWIGFWKQNDW